MRKQHRGGAQTSRNGKLPSNREIGMKGERTMASKPGEDKEPMMSHRSEGASRGAKREGYPDRRSFSKRDRPPKESCSKTVEPKPSEEATDKVLPDQPPACVDDMEEEEDCQEESWAARKPECKPLECCNQSAEVLVAE
jgi:hypothetical protein